MTNDDLIFSWIWLKKKDINLISIPIYVKLIKMKTYKHQPAIKFIAMLAIRTRLWVSGLPVHHLPLPLACDHVQQGLSEVVSNAAITNHLIPKDDKTQVVDILYIVLLYVHPVLWDKQTKRRIYVCIYSCIDVLAFSKSEAGLFGLFEHSFINLTSIILLCSPHWYVLIWSCGNVLNPGRHQLLTIYIRISLIITIAVWWSFQAWFKVWRKLLFRELRTSSRTFGGEKHTWMRHTPGSGLLVRT